MSYSEAIDVVLSKLSVTEGEKIEGKVYVNNGELLNTYNNLDGLVICIYFDGLKVSCYPVSTVDPYLNIKLDRLLKGNLIFSISLLIHVLLLLHSGQRTIAAVIHDQQSNVVAYKVEYFYVNRNNHVNLLSLTHKKALSTDEVPSRKDIFDEIYLVDFWKLGFDDDKTSSNCVPSSGIGSSRRHSALIQEALYEVLTSYNIHTILDAPCGDLSWIPYVFKERMNISYIGGDISQVVIDRNIRTLNSVRQTMNVSHPLWTLINHTNSVSLAQMDLVEASALEANIDLLFCRHMMIHLTVTDNLKVLENIENSGVRYLMATTFLTNSGNDPINVNTDDFRLVLGHEINLMQSPYCLRPPIKLFLDASHDDVNNFSYMGLWDITMKPFRRESC